jgi:diguanylate cyclase (GGDEF)-like protein
MMYKRGYLAVPQVKLLKEEDPFLYAKLADCRIWSLTAMALRESGYQVGTLFVLNPHKRLEETALLNMVAEVLTTKILRQNLVEQHEYEHTHDVLTDLWNRRSFSRWFWDNQYTKFDSLGIITTDVIHLSDINRHLGYESGDKSLSEVAEILRNTFATYLVFRYDADEMLAICPNVDKPDIEILVGCLREKLAELGFAVAMGYAWSINPDIRHMITEAEAVMDNDKLKLLRGATASTRMAQSVIGEVEELMKTGHYLVYLQPKVNLHTGRTEGAEALVRQLDDVLGIVGPGMFIPILEHYNLVHMIDLFVLKEVFRYQQEELAAGRRTVPISVNFSKMTIMYPDIVDKVCDLKEQYDIPEGLIQIEVTETIGDMDHAVIENVANSLKALGFKLSMDDFGSHYSNLPVLIQYDFDSAKIDRSMVMEITDNPKSRLLLQYMTSMINDLGIECIVEGVETQEQIDILKETKAEIIQGFYFGRPVPKEEFYDRFVAEKGT